MSMLLQIIDYCNRKILFPWRENRIVSNLAPLLNPTSKVLDFGCGDGHLSLTLAWRSGVKIIGIDIYKPREVLIPRILYDGSHLPLKDNSFDGAIMVDMLHHTQDIKETLRSVARVSRRFLLIKDMKYRTRLGYFILKFTDLWTNKPDPNALLRFNYLTWKKWQEIFADLGLSISYYKPSFRLLPLDPIQHLNFIVLLEKEDHRLSTCETRIDIRNDGMEKEVLKANRSLYDNHGHTFHKLHQKILDGEESYINNVLHDLRAKIISGKVLDIGCGSGQMTYLLQSHFQDIIGIDLSLALLKEASGSFKRACGDVQYLPFRNGSFSLLLCNYTLHHLYSIEKFLAEAYRVLAPGGILFIDHEMKSSFMRRFHWLIKIHDRFFGLDRRYRKMDRSIHLNQVQMAEYHYFRKRGISCDAVCGQLVKVGFTNIQVRHHWYGVNRMLNYLFTWLNIRSFPAFISPHFSVTAHKPDNYQ